MTAIQAFIAANQAVIGLVILGLMLTAFVTERVPATVVAITGACTFLALGILDSASLFGVFSNHAPITIAAMFVLSGALIRTGTLEAAANFVVARARKHPRLATAELMVGVFVASAFMNNTPIVIVMIPIIARLAAATGFSVKKLLIPLSFFAIMGGTTTLIGTSTNLLVDGVASEQGLARFGIFEITVYGLVAAAAGTAALLLLGRWLLPEGEPDELFHSGEDAAFLTELYVPEDSEAVGRTIKSLAALRQVSVIAIKRDAEMIRGEVGEEAIAAGDRLVVRAGLQELLTLRNSRRFQAGLAIVGDAAPDSEAVVEATVAPSHPSLGRRLAEIPFLNRLPVRILGVNRHNHLPGPDLPNSRIRPADRLLVTGSEEAIRRMYENPHLIGVGQTRAQAFRRGKAPIAALALAAVVTLSALDLVGIGVAAILAVGIILVTRCIDTEEAWRSIDGNVLVLIFAMLAVGVALDRAGSVQLIISGISPWLGGMSPLILLFTIYVVSSILTEVVTNNAVAVIMTPLVIALGVDLGIDPRPLVIAVMFAASASFATPIGYQTNTMVYAAGNYRFLDFVKVGVPMNLIVGLATCIALSVLY
ncbi:MAG: SLC13 family permease [Allosphingosinicella sp.]|uniref:SLC13 family permease n=1 Tax=Allosphingosinicella sp. TaxID=2823234 RepID=UPI0039624D29